MAVKNHDGTHISHCCVIHGCSYGSSSCVVTNGTQTQEYLCELCDHTLEEVDAIVAEAKRIYELKEKIRNSK